MKTKQKRYERVLNSREQASRNLMRQVKLSDYQYNNALFQTGTALLKYYFGDLIKEDAFNMRLYDMLLKQERMGFWPWFINQFELAQLKFLRDVQQVFNNDVKYFGKEKACTLLWHHWNDFQAQFAHDEDVEERLRQFIIQLEL
jgi:hypothetical protein